MASAVLEREALPKGFMCGKILKRDELPKVVASCFQTDEVRAIERDGEVVILPIDPEQQLEAIEKMCAKFAGRGWSSENFLRNKKFEKELEG